MGNEAFQNALYGSTSFPNVALSYNCLWAKKSPLSDKNNKFVHFSGSSLIDVLNTISDLDLEMDMPILPIAYGQYFWI